MSLFYYVQLQFQFPIFLIKLPGQTHAALTAPVRDLSLFLMALSYSQFSPQIIKCSSMILQLFHSSLQVYIVLDMSSISPRANIIRTSGRLLVIVELNINHFHFFFLKIPQQYSPSYKCQQFFANVILLSHLINIKQMADQVSFARYSQKKFYRLNSFIILSGNFSLIYSEMSELSEFFHR